ncbi:MAG: polysaccharide export protein [Desulfobacteraceae bacterium]|nr:polysaccharide export protein [Desulfobacteraceae bacterium]
MKNIKRVVLSILFFASSVLICQAAGFSVGESVAADPDKELAEITIPGEENIVFGGNLFNGHFRDIKQPGFNPDYFVNIGDIVSIRIWGAFEFAQELAVDSQGNIFLPKVGIVQVIGVKNRELVSLVKDKVKKLYNNKVFVYANVASYQPITVFVTGSVKSPGLYKGMSSDSVLQFIDRADGILKGFGSFRKIEILRGSDVVKQIDLYSFLVSGHNELFQFHSGDVVSVKNIMHQITVIGDVKRPFKFEFSKKEVSMGQIVDLAILKPETTNFTITRWKRDNKQILLSGSLAEMDNIKVLAGDTIEFFSDHRSSLNKINISGEQDGLSTILVKKDETLGGVLKKIKLNSRSNAAAVQVFRKTVADKQKQLLLAHLQELESMVLMSSSMTSEESKIRSFENKSYMSFIERAKKVEPKGQIVINEKTDPNSIYLEEGDQIYIPSITNLAMVQGEVSIPGAHTFVKGYSVKDYLNLSGGFTDRADEDKVLVISQNGSVKKMASQSAMKKSMIKSGDSVLVLPKVAGKNLQVAKGITQIMYQIAISVGVLLAI